MSRVYLDNAATTKIRPESLAAMNAAYNEYANPSSVHHEGQSARKALENARESVASVLHCDPSEVYFTSGGTEADNWAVSFSGDVGEGKRHIITSSIEHPAVLSACKRKESEGFRVTYLPVDRYGSVSADDLERAISDDTALVSVMMVNNEIGTIEPIIKLSEIAHAHGAVFHTDAVQAVGSLPVDFSDLHVDLLSFSSHKFYGPYGVGGLLVRKGLKIPSFLVGGSQEYGHRAGTENLPGIIGMAEALRLDASEMDEHIGQLLSLKNLLIGLLRESCPQVVFHGDADISHPGILNLYVPGMDGEKMLLLLDYEGFAISGGAACSSKDHVVSHVLSAIGSSKEEAGNSLRVSIGTYNTEQDIVSFVSAFEEILKKNL